MSSHSTAVRDAKCVDRNCAHIKALDIQLSLVQEWDETGSLHTAVDDEEERPAGLEWERSVARSVLPAPPPASCAHCSQNEFASLSFACGEFARGLWLRCVVPLEHISIVLEAYTRSCSFEQRDWR